MLSQEQGLKEVFENPKSVFSLLSPEEKESVADAGIDELVAMVYFANLRADLITKIRYSA